MLALATAPSCHAPAHGRTAYERHCPETTLLYRTLLKRVFLVDVLECPKCKGRMKILVAVTAPESVRRVLGHLGLP